MKQFIIFFVSFIFSSTLYAAQWDTIFDAAGLGKVKEVESFLENGISIESRDEDGFTPLLSALLTGNVKTTDYLLNQGADFQVEDNDGVTAMVHLCLLHLGTKKSQQKAKKIAQLVIKQGIDFTGKNSEGLSDKAQCSELAPEFVAYFEQPQ